MGFFDRLLGIDTTRRGPRPAAAPTTDAQALERYHYMLRTAPPETIEEAHREAFEKLTPEQRRQVLAGLAKEAPAAEAAAIAATPADDTRALARAATRAEIRQPGVLERTLAGGGMGFGAHLLSSFAMGFVGSMVANSFFEALGGFDHGDAAPHDEDMSHDGDDPHAGDDQLADYDAGDGGDDGGFDDGGGGDFEV
jgi:hypothetical protein